MSFTEIIYSLEIHHLSNACSCDCFIMNSMRQKKHKLLFLCGLMFQIKFENKDWMSTEVETWESVSISFERKDDDDDAVVANRLIMKSLNLVIFYYCSQMKDATYFGSKRIKFLSHFRLYSCLMCTEID